MSEPLPRRLAAELVGTFVFVLVGAGSAVGARAAGVSDPGSLLLIAALGNGIGLALAVTATMGSSGGVLNPAVAVALWIGKKLPGKAVVPYALAELTGAVLAVGALVVSLPSSVGGGAVHWGAPTLGSSLTPLQGTAVEALLTFVLVFAIYGTAIDPRSPKVGGLVIGLAVVADVLLGGALTGAAMNPARAMGPMLAGAFIPSYWYIYWLGPLIGGAAAAVAYTRAIEPSA